MSKKKTVSATLTGNDVALAASACALAMAWYRGQQPKSKWGKARIAELSELCSKLQHINDAAYPNVRYSEGDGFNAPSAGVEAILKLDEAVIAETRKLGAAEIRK